MSRACRLSRARTRLVACACAVAALAATRTGAAPDAGAPLERSAAMARAARALIERVLPGRVAAFRVEIIPAEDGADVFEIESRDHTIVLRGTNGVAVASALSWYLKYDCHRQLSWCGDNLALPTPLPAVKAKIRRISPYR